MYPKKFDYYAPTTLQEAIKLLHEKEDSKVLAGGQSLLALMKLRLAAPAALVDLSMIQDELSYVKDGKDHLAIGSMTPHDVIEHDKTIEKLFPILKDAASKIGDQQIRNLGTIGGSCCHADPASDLPAALLALDPEFVVQGPKKERVIKASEFFVDTFTTAVAKDEILTEIRIPHLPRGSGSAYIKHSRREGDFSIVSAGVSVTVGPGDTCKDARISLGAVAATPIRAKAAEDYLKGKKFTDKEIVEASQRANQGADPPSDMHGSKEYRMDMIGVFTKRAIKLALSRV
ncbi:MAG: xanthine dehydrogenase family protein subunit M [Thaumarchaeota archaeon]|nr:xanthine dehydrogenase family protein subunit M [Nitrososphaerota archaeon]